MDDIESHNLKCVSGLKNTIKELEQRLSECKPDDFRTIFKIKDQIEKHMSTIQKLQHEIVLKNMILHPVANKNNEFIKSLMHKTPSQITKNNIRCNTCNELLHITVDGSLLHCSKCAKVIPYAQTMLEHVECSQFAQDTYANHSEGLYTKTNNSNFKRTSLPCFNPKNN